jgi:hypothetical protein
MSLKIGSPVHIGAVDALGAASARPQQLATFDGKLWYSDGLAWRDVNDVPGETGSFTPILLVNNVPYAGAYGFRVGEWVRNGGAISASVSLTISGSAPTGALGLKISGFPTGLLNVHSSGNVGYYEGCANTFSGSPMIRVGSGGDADQVLLFVPATGAARLMLANDTAAGFRIDFTVTCRVQTTGSLGGVAFGSVDPLDLRTTSSAAPAADTVRLFRRKLAGRNLPAFVGPSGLDSSLQPALHGNNAFIVGVASGTTAPTVFGGTLTTAATMSMPALASTSLWASMQRKRFATSTTAGNASGMRTAYTQWWRGNAAGRGGFFFRAQFGQSSAISGEQKFIGLCASTGALAGEPSALVNMIGVGCDSTDPTSGNYFLMRNDATGAATKVDLGASAARNTNAGYDLAIFCRPHDGTTAGDITVRMTNLNTGAVILDDVTYTTDLPDPATFLAMKAECRNSATFQVAIEVAKLYVESDW